MLLAQLSDLHACAPGELAYGRVDTNAALAKAVDAVLRLDRRPDAVLVTGDLADKGVAAEYALVREELARLSLPTYVIPGNHDRREPLRAAFAGDGYLPTDGPFLHYALDLGPIRLIALDSLVEGQPHGELCALRLGWLERMLEAASLRPTVVMLHHPPFATGIAHMDAMGLATGAGALTTLIARYPNVERVLCGHVHRSVQARFAGTIASIAPSPAHAVALELIPGADAKFTFEPGAFHLHMWNQPEGLVTHNVHVDPWPGPYPFA